MAGTRVCAVLDAVGRDPSATLSTSRAGRVGPRYRMLEDIEKCVVRGRCGEAQTRLLSGPPVASIISAGAWSTSGPPELLKVQVSPSQRCRVRSDIPRRPAV